MGKRTLTENSRYKIIRVLANSKEFEQYRLGKETGLSYRTILRTLKPLERLGFIKLVRTEPSEKGGKEKKIYVLTFKGLWIYLCDTKLTAKQLEEIINRFPDMLLFFRKWHLFVEAGIQDKALDSFRACLSMSWNKYYDMIKIFTSRKPTEQQYYEFEEALLSDQKNFLDTSMLVGILYVPGIKDALSPLYMKDKEITDFIKSIFELKEKEYAQIEELKREFLPLLNGENH